MAESYIQLPPQSTGLKAHTFQRTVGANAVEDEVVIEGEHYLATYTVPPTGGASTATANSHLLQIMAGASLNVYVRWIKIYQVVAATASSLDEIQIFRLTTAGTGGPATTPAPMDSTDAASGATAMSLPTAKGTEGTRLESIAVYFLQTIAATPGTTAFMGEFRWDGLREKGLRIAAGTTNGICVKNPTARAAASVIIQAKIVEANF